MEKLQIWRIEAFKPHRGRVWHGIVERTKSSGVVLFCKPNHVTIDSWAEYADDFAQCKDAGWKICVGCNRAIDDIADNGN